MFRSGHMLFTKEFYASFSLLFCLSKPNICLLFFKTQALSQLLPCHRTCRKTDMNREEVRASLNDLSALENMCCLFPLVEVWIISPLRAAFSLIQLIIPNAAAQQRFHTWGSNWTLWSVMLSCRDSSRRNSCL